MLAADDARSTNVGKNVGWNTAEGVFCSVGKHKRGDHR